LAEALRWWERLGVTGVALFRLKGGHRPAQGNALIVTHMLGSLGRRNEVSSKGPSGPARGEASGRETPLRVGAAESDR